MRNSLWFILPMFLISASLSISNIQAQNADDSRIEWLTLEEAAKKNQENPRMIFIDFYTDWCTWCKKMDINVFANPQISQLMGNSFYAVKFNAESAEPVNFNGKTYKLSNEGRRPAHELAIELATHNERLGYPTFVVLDSNLDKMKTFQGYKTVDAMKLILEYYGVDDNYKKQNWIQFIQGSQATFD